jgi:hypothetical protein
MSGACDRVFLGERRNQAGSPDVAIYEESDTVATALRDMGRGVLKVLLLDMVLRRRKELDFPGEIRAPLTPPFG